MPKFVAIIDTDKKTASFKVDGAEVDVKHFTVNSYHDEGIFKDQEDIICGGACYSVMQEGERVCKSYSFDNQSSSNSESHYSMGKEVQKTIAMSISMGATEKAMAKILDKK